MYDDRAMFNELDEKFWHSVKLGNNTKMNIIVNHVVADVYYIPELRNNLLSIGQLQERGLGILIKGGMCKIFHPEKGLIIQTNMTPSQAQSDHCFHTKAQNLSHLWHRRYGHLSYKGLRTLLYKNIVRGLHQLSASSVTCTDCINGKQHCDPILKRSTWRATQKLERIYADICGSITPTSNSNKRYILLFIDDYSRKTWVYFLVEKSWALNSFKCFKTMVEKETWLFVKCLRTDRGEEFNSNEFNDFCKQSGIKRQLTTTYTP
ncbi:hypothetical protein ACOSQ4_028286 [Xanthoceras sorbifolium]